MDRHIPERSDALVVDYSPEGMLKQTIRQCIGMIDATILMDDQPMPPHIEARFAALRRLLRGGLVAADASDGDDDETQPVPPAIADDHRWIFRVDALHDDGVDVTGSDGGHAEHARLPLSLLEELDPVAGMEVTVRLVEGGGFHASRTADAPAPRNDTNPLLRRRDVGSLQRLIAGITRPRELASRAA